LYVNAGQEVTAKYHSSPFREIERVYVCVCVKGRVTVSLKNHITSSTPESNTDTSSTPTPLLSKTHTRFVLASAHLDTSILFTSIHIHTNMCHVTDNRRNLICIGLNVCVICISIKLLFFHELLFLSELFLFFFLSQKHLQNLAEPKLLNSNV